MRTRRWWQWWVVTAAGAALVVTLGVATEGADPDDDDIPVPLQWVRITPPAADIPADVAAFSGGWRGKWRPGPQCSIIVMQIHPRDRLGRYPVDAIYSWGSINIKSVWVAQPGFVFPTGSIGDIEGVGRTQLVLERDRMTLAFHFTGAQELEGRWNLFHSPFHYGTFHRLPIPVETSATEAPAR